MVPEVVIVPPVKPAPAVIEVTVPVPLPVPKVAGINFLLIESHAILCPLAIPDKSTSDKSPSFSFNQGRTNSVMLFAFGLRTTSAIVAFTLGAAGSVSVYFPASVALM